MAIKCGQCVYWVAREGVTGFCERARTGDDGESIWGADATRFAAHGRDLRAGFLLTHYDFFCAEFFQRGDCAPEGGEGR
jgi:hypothetical protein